MSSVIEMKSGEITYSGSLLSSLGGQTVTAAIAAAGRPETKQAEQTEVAGLIAGQGLERAAMSLLV